MSKTEWESMQGLLVDVVVYGKPVVMVTLNHIKRSEILEDRFGNEYKVRSLKQLGYTEIFHYEPLDRRGMDISYKNISSRFVFTDESIEQINKILIEQ